MSHRLRTTDWECPRCRRKTTTRQLFQDGNWSFVYQDRGPFCTGLIHGAHATTYMVLTGYTERTAPETEKKETTMPETRLSVGGYVEPRFPQNHPWSEILNSFNEEISRQRRLQREQREAARPENKFRALDVKENDRVRLTTLTSPDASQLEGVVLGVKVRDAGSQIRIKGFDHTGGNAGGQHVWFPVKDYTIEVLHRAYRWTVTDRITAEVGSFAESAWEGFTEETRERLRERYGKRVARIKNALGATSLGD